MDSNHSTGILGSVIDVVCAQAGGANTTPFLNYAVHFAKQKTYNSFLLLQNMNSVGENERIQKPARIPPQTPPAGGKSVESVLKPTHCPNTWRAEPRKKNTLSFFKRNSPTAKSEMQGVFFLSGLLAYSPVRGAFSASFVLEVGASLVQYRHQYGT